MSRRRIAGERPRAALGRLDRIVRSELRRSHEREVDRMIIGDGALLWPESWLGPIGLFPGVIP